MKLRDSFKSFWVSFRQWMFILYREERWKRVYMRAELRRKHEHETEVERLTKIRLQREHEEFEQAFQLGEKIIRDADLCNAKYGDHLTTYKVAYGDLWYVCLERRDYHRCQRCGMLFNNKGRECAPAQVGQVCDCAHCQKFVGSHLRRRKNG